MIGEPYIDKRPAKSYLGIRTISPFRTIFWEIELAIKLADE